MSIQRSGGQTDGIVNIVMNAITNGTGPRQYSREELIIMRHVGPVVFDTNKLSGAGQNCLKHSCSTGRDRKRDFRSDPLGSSSRRNMLPSSESSNSQRSSERTDEKLILQPRAMPAWHFRRRDQSTESSDQPLDAPTGLNAQRTENFQRFYRAVVSPSHVRVTAGGRIVPNYARPPPVFTWNCEEQYFEHAATQPSSYDPYPPLRDLSQHHNTKSNSNMESSFIPNEQHQKLAAPPSILTDGRPTVINNTNATSSADANAAPTGTFKFSHPGQFDVTRPFMYNGQLVYPLSSTEHQNVSADIHGNIGMAESEAASPIAQTSQSNQAMAPTVSIQQHAVSSYAMPLLPYDSTLASMAEMPSALFIKNQIKALQAQLGYLESQLEHNRDVIASDTDGHDLHSDRGQLPAPLHGANMPQTSSTANDVEQSRVDAVTESTLPGSSAVQEKISIGSTDVHAKPQAHNQAPMVNRKSRPSCAIPILPSPKATQHSEPELTSQPRKSRPAFTAMAPEFKPRAYASGTSTDRENSTDSPKSSFVDGRAWTFDQMPSTTPQLSSYPTWNQQVKPLAMTYTNPMLGPPAAMPGIQMPKAYTTHGNDGPYPKTLPLHTGRYDGAGGFHSFDTFGENDPATPYLMGFPPPGITFAKVRPLELLYTRPLTAEEKRARELYFSKAPKEASRGLPKYDGRDFYRPSPVKDKKGGIIEAPEAQISSISAPAPNASVWIPTTEPKTTVNMSDQLSPSIGNAKVKASVVRAAQKSDMSSPASNRHAVVASAFASPERDDDNASVDSWDIPKEEALGMLPGKKVSRVDRAGGEQSFGARFQHKAVPESLVDRKPDGAASSTLSSSKWSPRGADPIMATLSSANAHTFLPHRFESIDAWSPVMSNTSRGSREEVANAAALMEKLAATKVVSPRSENRPPSRAHDAGPKTPTTAAEFLRRIARSRPDSRAETAA